MNATLNGRNYRTFLALQQVLLDSTSLDFLCSTWLSQIQEDKEEVKGLDLLATLERNRAKI